MSGQREVKPSRRILAEVLGIQPEIIRDSSKLGDELGLGRKRDAKLEIAELWFALEEAYDTDIPVRMRPSSDELQEKTAGQFDLIIASLVGNSEPLEDENPRPACDPALSGDAAQ
jgi:acyl carrier protein